MRSVSCSGVGRSSPPPLFDFVTMRLAAKKATRAMMELVKYGMTRLVQDAMVVIVDGFSLTKYAGPALCLMNFRV